MRHHPFPRASCVATCLLTLPLLAGCGELPTDARGEGPSLQLHHGPGHAGGPGNSGDTSDGRNYDIVITGDVSGSGRTDDRTTGVVARGYTLDLGFLQAMLAEGFATCFTDPTPEAEDGDPDTEFEAGPLAVGDDPASASFFFEAKDRNGNGVKYAFTMTGGVPDGSWPPASGQTTTVSYDGWSVAHDSKGSKKSSCSGSGALSATMSVTGL